MTKQIRDYFIKLILGKNNVPRELMDLSNYFRTHDPINFSKKIEGDILVAKSTNFRFGSIITSGKNEEELEENIKDAILTSFDVPSSYAKEAQIGRVGAQSHKGEYAFV